MLEFFEDGHRYVADGREVVSTTQVIGDLCPLPEYAKNENAAEFGSYFHKLTELYDNDDIGSYEPEFEPWLDGWKKFRADFPDFKLIASEQKIYNSTYDYAGTIDRIYSADKGSIILDIKTGCYSPRWDIQLAAYQYLAQQDLPLVCVKRWAVQVKENDYKIHKCKNPYRIDFNTFVSMLNVKRWKQNNLKEG